MLSGETDHAGPGGSHSAGTIPHAAKSKAANKVRRRPAKHDAPRLWRDDDRPRAAPPGPAVGTVAPSMEAHAFFISCPPIYCKPRWPPSASCAEGFAHAGIRDDHVGNSKFLGFHSNHSAPAGGACRHSTSGKISENLIDDLLGKKTHELRVPHDLGEDLGKSGIKLLINLSTRGSE